MNHFKNKAAPNVSNSNSSHNESNSSPMRYLRRVSTGSSRNVSSSNNDSSESLMKIVPSCSSDEDDVVETTSDKPKAGRERLGSVSSSLLRRLSRKQSSEDKDRDEDEQRQEEDEGDEPSKSKSKSRVKMNEEQILIPLEDPKPKNRASLKALSPQKLTASLSSMVMSAAAQQPMLLGKQKDAIVPERSASDSALVVDIINAPNPSTLEESHVDTSMSTDDSNLSSNSSSPISVLLDKVAYSTACTSPSSSNKHKQLNQHSSMRSSAMIDKALLARRKLNDLLDDKDGVERDPPMRSRSFSCFRSMSSSSAGDSPHETTDTAVHFENKSMSRIAELC